MGLLLDHRCALHLALILAPPFVLDDLAIHEVAHLVELSTIHRVWRLVDRMCPDAERAKVWLDVHGSDLHRYGLPDSEPDIAYMTELGASWR